MRRTKLFWFFGRGSCGKKNFQKDFVLPRQQQCHVQFRTVFPLLKVSVVFLIYLNFPEHNEKNSLKKGACLCLCSFKLVCFLLFWLLRNQENGLDILDLTVKERSKLPLRFLQIKKMAYLAFCSILSFFQFQTSQIDEHDEPIFRLWSSRRGIRK